MSRMKIMATNRCSEAGGSAVVAIVASRVSGRRAWVVNRRYALSIPYADDTTH